LENEVAEKKITNVSMMKFVDWVEMWFQITRPFIAPTTRKAYRLYIDRHFIPAFGDMKLCDITNLHVKAYIAKKLTDDGLSSTTVRKHFYTLGKILFDALKYNSPMIGMKAPEFADYEPIIPTKEQFEEIRSTFAEFGPEHEAVILLAGWCGLRRGEIFAFKWDDIDEQNGVGCTFESCRPCQ